jgi:hypothetical protein
MLVLMNATVLLAIIAVVFGAIPLLIGSNAVYIFLTLCSGELLAQLTAKDITQIINSLVAINGPVYSIVQIILLVVAPLVVLVMFRKGVKPPKRVLQIVPSVSAVIICFMLVVAKLPYDSARQIMSSDLYLFIKPYYELAIAAGLLVSLIYLWTKRPEPKLEDKKHK